MRDGYGHKNLYCYCDVLFQNWWKSNNILGGRASSDSEAKALAKAEAKSRIKDCREYAPKIIDKR